MRVLNIYFLRLVHFPRLKNTIITRVVAIATFLINFGVHIIILDIIKVRILLLVNDHVGVFLYQLC